MQASLTRELHVQPKQRGRDATTTPRSIIPRTCWTRTLSSAAARHRSNSHLQRVLRLRVAVCARGIDRLEKGPAARVAGGRNHQSRIRSGGSTSGRQLQLSWRLVRDRVRPNQVGDPAAGDQDGLLWFDPAAFVTSAGTASMAPRLSLRSACPAVTSGTSPVSKNVQPCRHDSSPVQGRPDQRVQSDPVPRRRYTVCNPPRPGRRRAERRSRGFRPKSRARDRRARSSLASDSIGEINRDRHESTLEVLLDDEPADRVCGVCHHATIARRRADSRRPEGFANTWVHPVFGADQEPPRSRQRHRSRERRAGAVGPGRKPPAGRDALRSRRRPRSARAQPYDVRPR